MATEDKSAQRIKENRDPSFTATPVKENPSGLNTLEYADQDVLDTERPPKIRTTLSPEDFNISDEDTTYKELFISDQNAGRFQPPQITGENAPDIYQERQDDIQLKPQEYENNIDCVCADGRASKGRKNKRTGQIDCNCDTNLSKKPSIYKPVPVKPRVVDTAELKDQAGVSYMGNVKLEPCKITENEAQDRADGTLNRVIQSGRETIEDTNRGKTINPKNNSQEWNIYETNDYNIYGI